MKMKWLFMKNYLLLVFAVFTLLSCTKKNSELIGIWIGDGSNYFNPDTTQIVNTSLQQGLPILLDFKNNKDLTLKVFGRTSYDLEWDVVNDSILKVNDVKYKIISSSKDCITLELNYCAESINYNIYRINDTKIEQDSTLVIKNICSSIWSSLISYPAKVKSLHFGDHLEYFGNNIRLSKYLVADRDNPADSTINLQVDRWAVGKYKDYYFISDCWHQLAGSSPFSGILFQINEINDSVFKIYRPQIKSDKNVVYYGHKSQVMLEEMKKGLVGLWKSENGKGKSYGGRLPKMMIERGIVEKYEGDLFYRFDKDNLKQYGYKTDTLNSNWYLNNDGTVLFL